MYDSLNCLIRENNYDLNKTIVYEYDNSGNLFRRKEYAYTTGTISSEPTASTVFIGGNWVDQVKTVRNVLTNEDKDLEYDNSGKMTKFGNKTFTWDDNGKLTKVTTGSECTEYLYDKAGNRVCRKQNDNDNYSTEFKYINGKLVKIYVQEGPNSDYNIIFLYNATGIIGFQYGDNLYTYRKNLFGDITEIYKGAELVAKYAYDAFGNCTIVQNNSEDIANINPFRYRGYL